MKLFYLVFGIVVVVQVFVAILNTIVAKNVGLAAEFYKQPDLDSKRDDLFKLYSTKAEALKRDSIEQAIVTENLVNRIIPDGKDLSKSFLTLVVGVLVAAITFGEKVVQFSTAGPWAKAFIISSWIFLSIAIVVCGLGIIFLMYCEGQAINTTLVNQKLYPEYFANGYIKPEYLDSLNQSTRLFFHAGITFGGALLTLMIAGIISNISKSVSPTDVPKEAKT